jgi:hypothetical protein
MKKLLVCLFVLVGFSLFALGCASEEKGHEHPETEHHEAEHPEGHEHPEKEHPSKAKAPKDHPAH